MSIYFLGVKYKFESHLPISCKCPFHLHPKEKISEVCKSKFAGYIAKGVEAGRLSDKLQGYDLEKMATALRPERDAAFPYLGLQTIYDRYLLHIEGTRIETPQYFWMRVAMGLAWNEWLHYYY